MKPSKGNDRRPQASSRRAILTFDGALTHENCNALKQEVKAEIHGQRSEVILDFKHVILLDSAALEVLVDLHETMLAHGKSMKIIRLQTLCRDILLATRTIHKLKTYEDLHAAITHTP